MQSPEAPKYTDWNARQPPRGFLSYVVTSEGRTPDDIISEEDLIEASYAGNPDLIKELKAELASASARPETASYEKSVTRPKMLHEATSPEERAAIIANTKPGGSARPSPIRH